MSKLLKTVLERDEQIYRATNSYIDDILVDQIMVTAQKLSDHLKKSGLVANPGRWYCTWLAVEVS